MRILVIGATGLLGTWNIDMSRHARELMPPAEYLATSYYEHWLWGLEHLLVAQGLLTPDEIEARVDAVRRDATPPPPRAQVGSRVVRHRSRGHRGGPHSRCPGAEADHARDAPRHEGRSGLLRRRHRPGRLRRDVAADDAQRARVRSGRRHALLRREHARSSSHHLHQGADERDAPVRRGDRRARAGGGSGARSCDRRCRCTLACPNRCVRDSSRSCSSSFARCDSWDATASS